MSHLPPNIYDQRNKLFENAESAIAQLQDLRANLLRKIAAPYGDGSHSNMVNVETDVIPQIESLISTLSDF